MATLTYRHRYEVIAVFKTVSMATSLFLFLLVNIQETMAGLLLSLRRYLSNACKINIKNTFLTSLYGGKCTFLDV